MTAEQLDLLDAAAPDQVGAGAMRMGKNLRRLVDGGVVAVAFTEGGVRKITVTSQGRAFLSLLRGHRLTI